MRNPSAVLSVVVLALAGAACGTRFPARDAEPRVAKVLPATGPEAGGTLLVVEGLEFRPGVKVFFGTDEAKAVTLVSGTVLTAVTPPGKGAAAITVLNVDGLKAQKTAAFTYAAPGDEPAPEIESVTPGSGLARERTFAELWGRGFSPGLLVFVGGVPATKVTAVSGELATALLPTGIVGAADVAVTTTDGRTAKLEKAFGYVESLPDPAPLITGILPRGGPASGGVKGSLTGAHFVRGARVYLGGRPASSVFHSKTLLDVAVPEGEIGLADVAVTNPDGQSFYSPGLFSYYEPGPAIFLIAPDVGRVEGGTEIVLSGVNLRPDTVVSFGEQPAAKVTFVDARTLKVLTPPVDSWGAVDVRAKNPDGQEDVKSRGFYFYDADHPPQGSTGPLLLQRALPASGNASGGTLVLLSGSGFVEGARVSFGTTAAQDVRFLSPTALSVRTPASTPGPADVTVTLPSGASAQVKLGFTFFDETSNAAAPSITGLLPPTGPDLGGTRALIAGRNFAAGASVYFGETLAPLAKVVDERRITLVTPVHEAGLVDVMVVNPDGKSARLPLGFAFYTAEGAGPELTGVEPPAAPTGREARVSVIGAGFLAGAQLFLGDVPLTDATVTNAGQMAGVVPSQPPGAYAMHVTNPDGRSATKAEAFRFTTPTPQVTRVVPALGPAQGGIRVLVQGGSFLGGARVLFGTEEATEVLFIEEGALLATAPAGAQGRVDVRVVNPGGAEATLAQAFEYREGYTPLPPPSIEALVPPSGPTGGGTVLLLKGANFQDGMVALFGSNPARRVLVGKNGEAVVVAPAGAVGSVDVTIVNPDGQIAGLAAGFRYVEQGSLQPAPGISGVIPGQGPERTATDLLVTGRRFAQGAMVFVGRHVAPFARHDSDTLLSSRAPAGQVGAVDVAVTNPDGQSSILEDGFIYRAAPVVESVSPAESPDSGGKQVQVFGAAFEPTSKVFFGNAPAQAVTFIGPTLLVAVTPPHTAGLVDVAVANPDGQEGVLESAFTFRAPPEIQGVMPAAGPVTGGTIAAIAGRAFVGGAKVLFDGAEVETGFGDDRTLAIRVPKGAYAGQEVTVTIVNPDGQRHEIAKGFRYLDPSQFTTPEPTLAAAKPGRGPDRGGTYALLEGTSIETGAIAFVGNRLVSQVKVSFGTALTGYVPGGPVGAARVAITNADGRSAELADGWLYVDSGTLGPAPTVVSTTPQQGVTRGGEPASMGGTQFATAQAPLVFLAGFPATDVEAVASTTLRFETGKGVVGRGDVVVTNPDGQSASLENGWTYEPTAPSFQAEGAVLPSSGPTRGGTTVTIRGLDFEFGAEVRFGSTQGTGVQFVSPTELKVRTPPGPIGKVDVTVVNPGGKFGTLANAFEFVPPPLILSVTPASGPMSGGNAFVINGRYFRNSPNPPKVRIGAAEAVSVKMESPQVITGIAPAGTGTAAVTVVNGDDQIGELGAGYVYLPAIEPPSIVAASPDNGEAEGGTYVTIVGNGFSAGAKVFFGEAEASEVRVMSGGALTCRTPAGVENARVPITVRNPPHPGGVEATKAGAFLYRPGRTFGTLTLTFVSPQQGPCGGGTEILIGGEGIKSGAKVYLDDVEQEDIRVFGPTMIAARTKLYGDPNDCPKKTVVVKVQNPTLEIATLEGAKSFSYVGGNRRFVHDDGDRLPAEAWYDKAHLEGNTPVVARLTGTTGGGRDLADILVGRGGNAAAGTQQGFNYYVPQFRVPGGLFWSDSYSSLKRYDHRCTTKVRPVDKHCNGTATEYTQNHMGQPLVHDFDKNGWDDVLYQELNTSELVILYNDAGVLTRYSLTQLGALCDGSSCATGNWSGHAIADLDLDAGGKVDIVVATTGQDVIIRNETTPTELGRTQWKAWTPSGAGARLRNQNSSPALPDDSRGVAVGDIDADGDVDIVMAGWNIPVKTYLSNLRNQGNVSPETARANLQFRDAAGAPFGTSTAWSGPMADAALADMDGDRHLDLVVTHRSQQDEYWRNDGAGHFVRETVTTKCGTGRRLPPNATQEATRSTFLDLDRDGDLDLVQTLAYCCSPERGTRVYRNDRQPADQQRAGCFVDATDDFFPQTPGLEVAALGRDIGFGDLDGDGYDDAVFAGGDGQQSRVYFNVAEGGRRVFRDRTRVRLPNRWERHTHGADFLDVDKDGDVDLVLSVGDSNDENESYLRLLLNDGAGYFTDASSRMPAMPIHARRIYHADIDKDGDPDLVLPNHASRAPISGQVTLLLNDGAGNFSDATYPRFPTGGQNAHLYAQSVALSDLDDDGDLDLAVGGRYTMRTWLNTGGGFFADISGTANPDQGTAIWDSSQRDLLAADFDGNGTQDLFVAQDSQNRLAMNCPDAGGRPKFHLSMGSAPCSPSTAPSVPVGGSWGAVTFTRDDAGVTVSDVLFGSSSNNAALWGIRLWRGSKVTPGRLADETVSFLGPGIPRASSSVGRVLSPLDYDDDGDPDFVLTPESGPLRILRNGTGISMLQTEPVPFDPMPYPAGDSPTGAIAADVNGDGHDDIFMMNRWNPRILISAP